MLFEIVVAALSSWWLAAETLSWKEGRRPVHRRGGALSGLVHRPRAARGPAQ